MVGRRSFPFGAFHLFSGAKISLISGKVDGVFFNVQYPKEVHRSESRRLATPKRWRCVRGFDKPRLMGVAPSTFQVVYLDFSLRLSFQRFGIIDVHACPP